MPLPSNIPPIVLDDNGVTIPETAYVLAGTLLNYRDAFGPDLNISSISTPQGYLSQEFTAAYQNVNGAIAYIYNNIDPDVASGRMQDAIGRIYFIDRIPGTATVVNALLTGVPGTIIPVDAQARDINGNIFLNTQEATFPLSGQLTLPFQCTQIGPIAVGPGELNQIALSISGWDAITNLEAGAAGTNIESRTRFELRRRQSVAINSTGSTQAVYANVMSLPGVIDCVCVDNFTKEIINYGVTNYPLIENSLVVSVVGGDNQQIAEKIFERKDAGCNMNGNTVVRVIDQVPLTNNKPEYDIKFLRPKNTAVKFEVQIEENPDLPNNIIELIQNRIIGVFNNGFINECGNMVKDRERILNTILASDYISPIKLVNSNINIINLYVGFDEANVPSVTMGIDQFPVTSSSDITVTMIEEESVQIGNIVIPSESKNFNSYLSQKS